MRTSDVCNKVDPALVRHMLEHGAELGQRANRWFNIGGVRAQRTSLLKPKGGGKVDRPGCFKKHAARWLAAAVGILHGDCSCKGPARAERSRPAPPPRGGALRVGRLCVI